LANETVLIVDDNAANLKLARVLLKSDGYAVHTATTAEAALDVMHDVRPDVILMDLQMPGMDGFELTRVLKLDPATRAIPIIAMTAYAMKGDEEKAIRAGCDEYVTKPIDTRALLALVARCVRAGSGQRSP
jgi:CheY-like chemotaxis protein